MHQGNAADGTGRPGRGRQTPRRTHLGPGLSAATLVPGRGHRASRSARWSRSRRIPLPTPSWPPGSAATRTALPERRVLDRPTALRYRLVTSVFGPDLAGHRHARITTARQKGLVHGRRAGASAGKTSMGVGRASRARQLRAARPAIDVSAASAGGSATRAHQLRAARTAIDVSAAFAGTAEPGHHGRSRRRTVARDGRPGRETIKRASIHGRGFAFRAGAACGLCAS
jgi:hypothetical protein